MRYELNLAKAKKRLRETDYLALKFIDGELTEEEYAPTREERKKLREKVRAWERVVKETSDDPES